MGFRKSNQNQCKKRKQKINLVFDETKRRDFLKGFHKRKLQRKKKAQEELQEKLKEEKRRIKQESKESYKKLVVSYRPIPELDDLLKQEYEDEDVTVKIMEISTNDIAKQSNWIGQNVPKEVDGSGSEKEASEEESEDDELPGMELKRKPEKKIVETTEEEKKKVFKSKKELNKHIKKQATKTVQKSKAFQMKYKQEQIKNKKNSMRMKHRKEKFLSKKSKGRHRGLKDRGKDAK